MTFIGNELRKRDVLAGEILFYFGHHERSIALCSLLQLTDESGGLVFAVEYCLKSDSAERNWVLLGERAATNRQEAEGTSLACFKQGDLWSYDLDGQGPDSLETSLAFAQQVVSAMPEQCLVWLDVPLHLGQNGAP